MDLDLFCYPVSIPVSIPYRASAGLRLSPSTISRWYRSSFNPLQGICRAEAAIIVLPCAIWCLVSIPYREYAGLRRSMGSGILGSRFVSIPYREYAGLRPKPTTVVHSHADSFNPLQGICRAEALLAAHRALHYCGFNPLQGICRAEAGRDPQAWTPSKGFQYLTGNMPG